MWFYFKSKIETDFFHRNENGVVELRSGEVALFLKEKLFTQRIVSFSVL